MAEMAASLAQVTSVAAAAAALVVRVAMQQRVLPVTVALGRPTQSPDQASPAPAVVAVVRVAARLELVGLAAVALVAIRLVQLL